MSSVEAGSKPVTKESDGPEAPRRAPRDRDRAKPRIALGPILITLVTLAAAALLAWAGWEAYMAAPWTRDGTVRVYITTMAPEVAGRIVEMRVADNQFVHKGDLLLVIDPTNFKIALQLADAAVDQAQATTQNAQREAER